MTFCIIIIRNFNLSRFFSEFLCWDSIFYQKSLPIQLLLYPLEGGFVRAAEGVQVDAVCQSGQRRAAAGFQPLTSMMRTCESG